MPRATMLPPARTPAVLAATLLVAAAAFLSALAPPAEAAKPCWERVIDDWVDNGTIAGNYSMTCIDAARRHVPEDIRAYTDIMDKLDAYRQAKAGGRSLASAGDGSGVEPGATGPTRSERTRPSVKGDGPIPSAIRNGTTDASSIPLPLIVLAGLALVLMAAGGAGFAHRKLQARKNRSS